MKESDLRGFFKDLGIPDKKSTHLIRDSEFDFLRRKKSLSLRPLDV